MREEISTKTPVVVIRGDLTRRLKPQWLRQKELKLQERSRLTATLL